MNLRSDIARVAQQVYNKWDEDEDEYAGGGICHLIAEEIVNYLSDKNLDAVSFSCSVGENHVMVAVEYDDNAYIIDISPHVYETGGGYSWNKIQDVEFTPNDIDISLAPEDFSAYSEEY